MLLVFVSSFAFEVFVDFSSPGAKIFRGKIPGATPLYSMLGALSAHLWKFQVFSIVGAA